MTDDLDSIEASATTLELAPLRATRFLLGVNTHPRLRALLAGVGYDQAEHERGWSLVQAFDRAGAPTAASLRAREALERDPSTRDALDAQATLDALDEKWFTIIAAALEGEHPQAHALLLEGLEPSSGPSATSAWRALLERYRGLEKQARTEAAAGSKKKPAKPPAGDATAAALATLARHGFGPGLVAELEALVARATALGEATPADEHAAAKERRARVEAAQKALYVWIRKWSRIAPKVVSRRDWLITLGLAERRKKAKSEPAPAPAE